MQSGPKREYSQDKKVLYIFIKDIIEILRT